MIHYLSIAHNVNILAFQPDKKKQPFAIDSFCVDMDLRSHQHNQQLQSPAQ